MQKKIQLKDLPYDIFAGHVLPMLDHHGLCQLINADPSLLSDEMIVGHVVPRFKTMQDIRLVITWCPLIVGVLKRMNYVYELEDRTKVDLDAMWFIFYELQCRQQTETKYEPTLNDHVTCKSWSVNGLLQGYTPDLPAKVEESAHFKLEIWCTRDVIHRTDNGPAIVLTHRATGKVLYEAYYQCGVSTRKRCSKPFVPICTLLNTMYSISRLTVSPTALTHPCVLNAYIFPKFYNCLDKGYNPLLSPDIDTYVVYKTYNHTTDPNVTLISHDSNKRIRYI